MRLLAAFQNTTRMAMYPRENRKEGPRRAALGRRSGAATCSKQIFSAISFIWMMTSEGYSPKLAQVRKADSPSLAG